MTPVWTTIFEIFFLKKKPGWERAVTLGLALGGLWLVFSKETIIPLPQNAGDWIALAGGAIFAAGLIRLEIIKTDGVFPIIFSFFSIVANELMFVFYNALLPSVATKENMGRVSGWAWGVGYFGAIIALAIGLFVFILPETAPCLLYTSPSPRD